MALSLREGRNLKPVEDFVKERFSEYYRKNSRNVEPPPSIEKREFGFILFKERMMVRHKSFRTSQDLARFLENTAPSDAYHSTAYYSRPEEAMENKGWLGADLCFDIDADHIPTACKAIHDRWICKDCGATDVGSPPDMCPKCRKERIDEETWLCEKCLDRARTEATKLVDILESDFGLSKNYMSAFFSGHRGYHLHVRADEVRQLNDTERKEIVDYVLGLGLDTGLHRLRQGTKGTKLEISNVSGFGWNGRLAKGLFDIMSNSDERELADLGLKRRAIKDILETREQVPKEQFTTTIWKTLYTIGPKTWQKIAERAIYESSVKIDTVVTTDIHRLIRLSGTLNGKTGLKVVNAPVADLERFDPFKEAVAFVGEDTVYIKEAPQFRLGEEVFGPYQKEKRTLPRAAAILLICKGKAAPVIS